MYKKGQKGFSFVEIMLGVVILGVLIVPLLGLFSSSSRATKSTVERAMALNLAADVIEYVRSIPYDSISKEHLDDIFTNNEDIAKTTNANSEYRREIEVMEGDINRSITSEDTAITTQILMKYKIVVVKALWMMRGKEISLMLSTIVINK